MYGYVHEQKFIFETKDTLSEEPCCIEFTEKLSLVDRITYFYNISIFGCYYVFFVIRIRFS